MTRRVGNNYSGARWPHRRSSHRAELVAGTQIGYHGRCSCGRVIYLAESSQSRIDGRVTAAGGWRHVTDPRSSMIPAKLRDDLPADRVGSGHEEDVVHGESVCERCGVIDADNPTVDWRWHSDSLGL